MLTIDARDREKLIDPLYKTSPKFWLLVAGLIIVIGFGVLMYTRQLIYGMRVTGMQRPAFWGMYMVNFIFFIGISHAGTLISAILRVTGAEWRRPITRVAEAITAFALMIGSLQIIFDMGRPDRLLYVILHGRLQSPILWDMVSVTAYILSSFTYLYLPILPDAAILRDNFPQDGPAWRKRLYTLLALGWRGNRTQWLRLEKAIAVIAVLIIPIAVSVHTIISWILATTLQPGWHSTIFGPYFVVGAIFSGIGALFVVMAIVRKVMSLEEYIQERQFHNLGLIFITMSAVWMYFTFAEHLTLAAGQQVNEFPVLASKLWGSFSPTFWVMVGLMLIAFWIMVIPSLIPIAAKHIPVFQPRYALGAVAAAGLTLFFLFSDVPMPIAVDVNTESLRRFLWFLLVIEGLIAGLGLAQWFKPRLIQGTLVASIAVLIGMWLERWNIIIPTVTHPYLAYWSVYKPTITELAITAGSVGSFILLFVLFFKIFPVISIWEVIEGRTIDEERSKLVIPMPKPSVIPRGYRYRHLRKTRGD